MGKDSVLGHDPLGWMKVVKENKKSISLEEVNAADQNAAKNDQPNSRVTVKQQKPLPPGNDNIMDVLKVSPTTGRADGETNNNAVSKPKVVIGRLYEKLSEDKTKSVPRNEGTFQESKPCIEPSFPVSRAVQPMKRIEPEVNRVPFTIPADRLSTYIIIAYTALLLILGFFVYRDLSKRTSRVEARLFAIEKVLHSKQR